MTTINTPDAVPNDVIRASWGDAVRGDLNRLNDNKIERNGSIEMTGHLVLTNSNPNNANHAVRKGYADAAYLQVDGGNHMTKDMDMGNHHITNMANPEGPQSAVTLAYANTWYVNKTGDTMTGILTLSDNADQATGARAAMPRSWILDRLNDRLALSGGTMSGPIHMGGSRITNLLAPNSDDDAATKKYVDDKVEASSDPRLKEVVEPITDAGARIQELAHKAFRGRWTAQGGTGPLEDMIAAPDIAVAAPYVVKGEPDAVDEHGNPKYMTVAFAHMVPLLVAALGEALDRIEQLEGRSDGVAAGDTAS